MDAFPWEAGVRGAEAAEAPASADAETVPVLPRDTGRDTGGSKIKLVLVE